MDGSMVRMDAAMYDPVSNTLKFLRKKAAVAVNDAMVEACWEIGRQIVEVQGDRAEYGKRLMEYLPKRVTEEFGKGFTVRNIRQMRQSYLAFPIRHTPCAQLSWSHHRLLSSVKDEKSTCFTCKKLSNVCRVHFAVCQVVGCERRRASGTAVWGGGATRPRSCAWRRTRSGWRSILPSRLSRLRP